MRPRRQKYESANGAATSRLKFNTQNPLLSLGNLSSLVAAEKAR